MLTGQRQESSAFFAAGLAGLPALSGLPAPRPASEQARPVVRIEAEDVAMLPIALNWQVAGAATSADFIWNPGTGEVGRSTGDVVAREVRTPGEFDGAMAKWTLVMALRPLVSEIELKLEIAPSGSDYLYAPDDIVTASIVPTRRRTASARDAHATVFNLSPSGEVQLIYPLAGESTGAISTANPVLVLETEVIRPLGADHLVAVITPEPPRQLRAILRKLSGRTASASLGSAIRQSLADYKGRASLSVSELYSGE